MLTVPKEGARLGLDDPLCRVKTTAMLTTPESTEIPQGPHGHAHELYNHCKENEPRPQQD